MLTRLIVGLYAWLIEISLWLMLLTAGVFGYYYAVPFLVEAGAILENESVWNMFGAFFFVAAAFLLSAMAIGPLLLLVDIRKSVRALEARHNSRGGGGRVKPVELKEPSF